MIDSQIDNKARKSNKSILLVILPIIALVMGVWYAGSHHFVKTRAGIKIYPKSSFSFSETYINMQGMPFGDLRYHQDILKIMTMNGDLEYVPGGETLIEMAAAGESIVDAVTKFDNEYQVSSSLREMGRISREAYDDLNRKYDVEGKTERVVNYMQEKAQEYNVEGKTEKAVDYMKEKAGKFNKWLKKR
ncbi:MAG: hypothetical protein ACE5EE_05780 [Fidelibacterota bacterium]